MAAHVPHTTTVAEPHKLPDEHHRRRRGVAGKLAKLAATGGVAAGLMAVPAVAGATVDNSTSQWSQPAGAVYTLQKLNNLSGSHTDLLEDNGNAMSNGALVDTWAAFTTQYPDPTNTNQPVQANEQWVFIPQSNNTGGKLTTGYGQLRNRQSGLCLDINGSLPGDPKTVDQWTCVPGAQNEEWTAKFNINLGAFVIQAEAPQLYLGSNSPNCGSGVPGNQDGTDSRIWADDTPSACTVWFPQQASYDFATDLIKIPSQSWAVDVAGYGCTKNYTLRQYSGFTPGGVDSAGQWDVADLSSPTHSSGAGGAGLDYDSTNVWDFSDRVQTNQLSYKYYPQAGDPSMGDGQVILYCDPQSTNP